MRAAGPLIVSVQVAGTWMWVIIPNRVLTEKPHLATHSVEKG